MAMNNNISAILPLIYYSSHIEKRQDKKVINAINQYLLDIKTGN